jgi:hypothetical protein
VLTLGGAAFGAASWTEPDRLTPEDGGPSAECPQVVSNSAGDAIAAWQRGSLVQAVTRPRGAVTWSSPVDVADGRCPNVALTEAGDAIAVFTKGDVFNTNTVFQAVFRPRGTGDWEPPVTLSSERQSEGGDLAVDPKGDAVAAGIRFTGRVWVVQAAYRSAASGAWEAAVDLSGPDGSLVGGYDVALDRAGNAVALFTRVGPVADSVVLQARLRPASAGVWLPAVDLAGPYRAVESVSVAIDGAGNATAAWVAARTDPRQEAVEAIRRPAGGTWSRPARISAAGNINGVQLAVGAGGDAVALWRQARLVEAAARPTGSPTWQPAVELYRGARNEYVAETALALDPRGDAVALWTVAEKLRAAVREAATDVWLPSVEVAGSSYGLAWPSVALDGAGNAIAAWGEQEATARWFPLTSELSATAFDTPVLVNVGRPSVRGTSIVGGTVTCFPGRWKGTQPIAYSYAWLRNGRLRSVGRGVRIRRADAGSLIACRVRAANASGAKLATSPAVRVPRR